jgi:hypothetical protein
MHAKASKRPTFAECVDELSSEEMPYQNLALSFMG